jgi:hypothetical protein
MNKLIYYIFLVFFILIDVNFALAQVKQSEDTFFLMKKKGLLKKLGKSIYVSSEDFEPVKAADPFLEVRGKIIRKISIAPTGFYTIVHDTVDGLKSNFGTDIMDYFHKNTLPAVVRKNLFFKEGDRILPRLLSDNERFFRELSFMNDAVILVINDSCSIYADVVILTRDVFTIGGSANVGNIKKAEVTVQDESIFGTGDRLELSVLYDDDRKSYYGFGGAYTKRNIGGSFINWTTGFKTFNPAFNSGILDENIYFTSFDKPLVSRYDAWTGAASFSYNFTKNNYIGDSVYFNEFKYRSINSDMWAGLNIGYKNKREIDSDKRLRHFVAMRTFYYNFYNVPNNVKNAYNPSYADLNGVLLSYSLYKQNFYKTNFIYGFGRNEDVPQGINASIVGGYTSKEGVKRSYFGLEFEGTLFSKKANFTDYTIRSGTFINNKKLQDASILIGINRFTKLYKLNSNWRNRNFVGINYTRQFNNLLSAPLLLESSYGLPYLNNNGIAADTRTTVKFESVFYNLKKVLGFRFAPFIFSDLSLVKPILEKTRYTKGFTAIGGGVRTRNENLVFGTIELKGYFFPRVNDGIKNWKVEFTSKIRFRYNSTFIRRPEFVTSN